MCVLQHFLDRAAGHNFHVIRLCRLVHDAQSVIVGIDGVNRRFWHSPFQADRVIAFRAADDGDFGAFNPVESLDVMLDRAVQLLLVAAEYDRADARFRPLCFAQYFHAGKRPCFDDAFCPLINFVIDKRLDVVRRA